jgi:hypothetical protein
MITEDYCNGAYSFGLQAILVQSRGSFPFFAHQHVLHSSLKASKGLQVKSSAVISSIVTSLKEISLFASMKSGEIVVDV